MYRYTKMAVESVLSKIHIHHKVYYCSDGQQLPFLNYQLIAEVFSFRLMNWLYRFLVCVNVVTRVRCVIIGCMVIGLVYEQ